MKTMLVLLLLFTAILVSAEPPEVFVGTDKFPQNGAYISPTGMMVGFPNGIAIRSVNHTNSAPPFSALPALGFFQSYSYPSTPDFEISFDNGISWNWVRSFCLMTTRVSHDADVDQTRQFSLEVQQMDIQGGGIPFGVIFRESPTLVSPGAMTVRTGLDGYYISSFFDVFMEVSADGGQSWTPGGSPLHLELYYPEHHPFMSDVFPPASSFTAPAGSTIQFPSGLILRGISHSAFSASTALPPLGGSLTHAFSDNVSFEYSNDGGLIWLNGTSSGNNNVRLDHVADDGSARFLDLEILQMNISGGSLPPGVFIRESPTVLSFGKHNVIAPAIGYQISSFFDVFLEVSEDGGTIWYPVNGPIRMELEAACPTLVVTPSFLTPARSGVAYTGLLAGSGGTGPYTFTLESGLLPSGLTLASDGSISGTPSRSGVSVFTVELMDMNNCTSTGICTLGVSTREYFTGAAVFPPAGKYLSPAGEVLSFPGGILVRNVVRREFSPLGMLPFPGIGQPYTAGGSVDLELSLNAGGTWSVIHAPATTHFNLTNVYQNASTEFHVGDISSFNVAGGNLPAGILLRESPTQPSRGGVLRRGVSSGYMIDSFFDIFIQVSLDGGTSWLPATDVLHLELWLPEERFPVLEVIPPPNAQYTSRRNDILTWTNGILAKDIINMSFDASIPPPQGSATVAFGSSVSLSLSMDAGLSWTTYTVPALNTMSVQLVLGGGSIMFYDTEMLQLDIAGGDLPPGMIIRESPVRASSGRHTSRSFTPDAAVQSFFDVFFEISSDGGMTFTPPLNYLTLDLINPKTISFTPHERWNLVSVPLVVEDYLKTTLFPLSISPAFAWNNYYVVADTLANGSGYWLKFSNQQTIEMSGLEIVTRVIPVSKGWNIVGSISSPVAVGTIVPDPPDMTAGPFWGFEKFDSPLGPQYRYINAPVIEPGKGYWVQVDKDGSLTLSSASTILPGRTLRIFPSAELPPPPPSDDGTQERRFSLAQNFPNPFNPSTVIRYSLPVISNVTLKVYDILGREVAVVLDGMIDPGEHSVEWNARDFPGGIYYCRLTADGLTQTIKVVLVK